MLDDTAHAYNSYTARRAMLQRGYHENDLLLEQWRAVQRGR